MVECPAGKLAGFFMRFTIRDLLWLTVVVVGLAVTLWIQHRVNALQHARDIDRIKELNGVIEVVENQLSRPDFNIEH